MQEEGVGGGLPKTVTKEKEKRKEEQADNRSTLEKEYRQSS